MNERQENKRLGDELLQHKKDGEKDLMIRRGKIIRKVDRTPPSADMDTTQGATSNNQIG